MNSFNEHRCADRLGVSGQNTVLVLAAAPLQVGVQLIQIASFRKRHPVVAAEVAAFSFHAALFVAASRVTELTLKTPVRTECNEAAGLLTAVSAQHLLHSTLQVVIA